MDNYQSVRLQMEAFGIEFKDSEKQLVIPTPKRKTCGKGGKWWYWLQVWRPRRPDGTETGAEYIVGKFGSYKSGESRKVEIDFQPLTPEERERFKAERAAAEAKARAEKEQAAEAAAITSAQLWQQAVREGRSPYLERKGVTPESCRVLADAVYLRMGDAAKRPLQLPAGTLAIPLLRYDRSKDEALRGLQLIKPDGFKLFTAGFGKTGCSVRLGTVDASTEVVMVCEGFATGLSIRMATGRRWPVYVALDAYNLVFVVELLRALHPKQYLLICADDDWKSADHDGANPGRTKARLAARTTPGCDFVWPVFDAERRQEKDTDFNDLHQREGIEAVERQLLRVLSAIEKGVHRRGA